MKLPYFKIGEAFREVRTDFSGGRSGTDKLTSVAKLMGKSVANVGMLAVDAGVAIVKAAPEIIGKKAKENLDNRSHLMSDEQIKRHHEMVAKGDDAKEQRIKKEDEARNQRYKKEQEDRNRLNNQ